MTNANDQVYSSNIAANNNGEVFLSENYSSQNGLTKREYFASKFMVLLMDNSCVKSISIIDRIRIFFGVKHKRSICFYNFQNEAEKAIEAADIFIVELNKTN